jgi:hypothetical protein
MKGLVKIEALKARLNSFEKFVRNTDATDETIELCIIQIKQLGQIIEDLTSIPTVAETPGEQKGTDEKQIINSLKKAFQDYGKY